MIRGIIVLGVAATAVLVVVLAAALLGVIPSGDSLLRPTWAWRASASGSGSPSPSPSLVPDPTTYTVAFLGDGGVIAKADCVAVDGRWRRMLPGRTGPLTRLSITIPPTIPACGPDSLAGTFLDDLRSAASYRVQDGRLTIILVGGDRLLFDPIEPGT